MKNFFRYFLLSFAFCASAVAGGIEGPPVAGTGITTSGATVSVTVPVASPSGHSGEFLTNNGTTTSWAANAGGDVVGPSSATDNAVVLFDLTTGKLLKNSTLIFNSGALTGATSINGRTAGTGLGNWVPSDGTGVTGADSITNMMSLTTAEYGAITPDPSTLYAITDSAVANYAVGVASGYKIARGSTALDGSNPTTVSTGLVSVVSCTGTLLRNSALTSGTAFLTHDTASGANVDFYAWILAGTASTGTESFEWICVGT